MINTNELNACFARKGMTKAQVAKEIGISPKTFYIWLDKGVMPTDKVEILINLFEIESVREIFCSKCRPVGDK